MDRNERRDIDSSNIEALVHQKITQLQAKEDTMKIARLRTTGDIHKIPELTLSVKLESIHQIFAPITSDDQTQCPMSILIEGHPGIGKTTLAKEVCLQWAKNQLLTSDKLVLLLMLRDPNVQKITSTEQLVRYTQSKDHVQCVIKYLQKNNGVGVTLIIDGFDELSTELRQASFFRSVIEGDILPNLRVVITSRPSASACLHQCVHKRIEILGFEKSSKVEYMNEALKGKPDNLRKLKVHFQRNPNIDALCYIPLNMAIIVYLCLLGSLPPTATKMYESFILHTVCRHFKKVGKFPNEAVVARIEDFPQPVCEVLQQLQKVAFQRLITDKLVFTVEELPVLCKDDPTCYGLLQSTECYCAEDVGNPTRSFNFLHLGIQEYFAAKYVTTLPEDELYKLLKESFIGYKKSNRDSKSVRLSNMWTLYCGITSGQCKTLRHFLTTYRKTDSPNKTPSSVPSVSLGDSHSLSNANSPNDSHSPDDHSSNFNSQATSTSSSFNTDLQRKSNTEIISEDILKDPVKVLFLFQCFQEAQDDALCEVLSKSFDNDEQTEIDIRGSLLPHHVVSLGYFLSRIKARCKILHLSSCNIGDLGINILHRYLCGDETSKQRILLINLSNNNLTGASLHLIADIVNHLQPLMASCKMHALDVSLNEITAEGATAISDMIICLGHLDITANKLGDHGVEVLSKGIADTKTLRVLAIAYNDIGSSGIASLANALKNNTSLLKLHVNGYFERSGTNALGDAITVNDKLETLSLWSDWPIDGSCAMDKESAMIIINSLYNNNTITELCLDIVLCKDDINDVTSEAEKVNTTRKLHNTCIVKFHLKFYDSHDDVKDLCRWKLYDFLPMEFLKEHTNYVTDCN